MHLQVVKDALVYVLDVRDVPVALVSVRDIARDVLVAKVHVKVVALDVLAVP